MSHLASIIKTVLPRSLRNWARSPRATTALFWDELRHAAGLDIDVKMRPEWTVRAHPAALRQAYFAQLSDPDQVVELDRFITDLGADSCLLDIGAHFGLFSLAALHYGGASSRAVAVDPSPSAVKMMRLSARLNHCDDRIEIVQACVGAQEGVSEMVPVGVTGAGYYVQPQQGHVASDLRRVTMRTVDGLANEYGLRPTHLKIDVEGAEQADLWGATSTLTSVDAPKVYLELHCEILRDRGEDPKDVIATLKGFGYEPRFGPADYEQAVLRLVLDRFPI